MFGLIRHCRGGRALCRRAYRRHAAGAPSSTADSAGAGRSAAVRLLQVAEAVENGQPLSRLAALLQHDAEAAALAALMHTMPLRTGPLRFATLLARLDRAAQHALAVPMLRAAASGITSRRENSYHTKSSTGDTRPRVLVANCMSGVLAERAARSYPRGEVLAVDWAPLWLETARLQLYGAGLAGRVELWQASIAAGEGSLGIAAGSLDAVLSLHSVYYWHGLDAALGECFRLLRPGGRLVVGMAPERYARLFNVAGVNELAQQRAMDSQHPPGQLPGEQLLSDFTLPLMRRLRGTSAEEGGGDAAGSGDNVGSAVGPTTAATAAIMQSLPPHERFLAAAIPSWLINVDAAEIRATAQRAGFANTDAPPHHIALPSTEAVSLATEHSLNARFLGADTAIHVWMKPA